MTLEHASRATGISISDITGPCRVRHLCWTRYAVMEVMRAKGLSLGTIGRLLKRDHSTVCKGLRQAEKLRGQADFDSIRSAIA